MKVRVLLCCSYCVKKRCLKHTFRWYLWNATLNLNQLFLIFQVSNIFSCYVWMNYKLHAWAESAYMEMKLKLKRNFEWRWKMLDYALMWFEWKSFCPMRILVSFDSIKLCLCTKTVLTVINSVLLYLSNTEKASKLRYVSVFAPFYHSYSHSTRPKLNR